MPNSTLRLDELAYLIVTDLIEALGDRKGFDAWWENIDLDIRDALSHELIDMVEIRLTTFAQPRQNGAPNE